MSNKAATLMASLSHFALNEGADEGVTYEDSPGKN